MSTVQDKPGIWSLKEDSRYEKCRNITEEIYKRINITFQIKQLETAGQSDASDQSDQFDSNELSNETDLFACDKTSISSSTEPEKPKDQPVTPKFINNNNNEEKPNKPMVVSKRPRKRFRKRVKKRQSKRASESDASSDEALPLSRMVDAEAKPERGAESPDRVMGVPLVPVVRLVNVLAKDLKPKIQPSEKKSTKMDQMEVKVSGKEDEESADRPVPAKDDKAGLEMKGCSLCSLSFRGERGLRRHMTMSHIASPVKSERGSRPA